MEMIGLKRNNIGYKEKAGRPRNVQKAQLSSGATRSSENAPMAVKKIDAFLT